MKFSGVFPFSNLKVPKNTNYVVQIEPTRPAFTISGFPTSILCSFNSCSKLSYQKRKKMEHESMSIITDWSSKTKCKESLSPMVSNVNTPFFFNFPRRNQGTKVVTGSLCTSVICKFRGHLKFWITITSYQAQVLKWRLTRRNGATIHSFISGTRGVNTTPFCAGTLALVNQEWT